MSITRRRLNAAFLACLAAMHSRAGRAVSPEPFYPPVLPRSPQAPLEFPKDHGAHPLFRTEWWYLTGWLTDANGEHLGVQLTFFRSRTRHALDNPSRFAPKQLLIAHAAIGTKQNGQLIHEEISSTAMEPLSGFSQQDCRLFIRQSGQQWQLERSPAKSKQGDEQYQVLVSSPRLQLELSLSTDQLPWLQGQDGYSQKGPLQHQASYYYSRPQLVTTGRVSYRSGKLLSAPTQVQGSSWFDHEWSSDVLAPGALGWDWLGLNMLDGSSLTIFRIRDEIHSYAAWRSANGEVKNFRPRWVPGRIWTSKRTNTSYPVTWTIALGALSLFIEPLMEDQELDGRRSTGIVYWEGAVLVRQSDAGGKLLGRGFLELTGYDKPMRL
jgi:predicted secreted hydrolase